MEIAFSRICRPGPARGTLPSAVADAQTALGGIADKKKRHLLFHQL